MKNIKSFEHKKYEDTKYEKVEDYIYKYVEEDGEIYYCTPISFEQEPEFDEGDDSSYISQYPLEDILDKFWVHISDFFDELNDGKSNVCYQEFSGSELKYVVELKNSIVGKHVYNVLEDECVKLIIE